jgi:hypothetical protein
VKNKNGAFIWILSGRNFRPLSTVVSFTSGPDPERSIYARFTGLRWADSWTSVGGERSDPWLVASLREIPDLPFLYSKELQFLKKKYKKVAIIEKYKKVALLLLLQTRFQRAMATAAWPMDGSMAWSWRHG